MWVLLLLLLLTCLLAPWLGVDTSDARSDRARPRQGWYPALPDAPESTGPSPVSR